MRSLMLFFIFLGYSTVGMAVPFIATLGYVWVDLLRPQHLAWGILTSVPVALILGGIAVGGYLLFDRRHPPKVSALLVMLGVFGIWVTLTTLWAEVPDSAWVKWDWAIKVIVFSIFVPFVIRSRIQIEAFLLTFLFSVSGVAIAYGIKTLFTGGAGYGRKYALNLGHFGLGESSTMALACVMLIPVIFYMAKHSIILRNLPFLKYLALGLAFVFLLAIVGSHARTGLVATAVIAGLYFLLSKRKMLFSVSAFVLLVLSVPFLSQEWGDRMQTIKTFDQDMSASSRVAVWRWTFDYSLSQPFGGGFDSYLINSIEIPLVTFDENGDRRVEVVTQYARAFHSNYFEVLGEHGWPGLFIYLTIVFLALKGVWRLHRAGKQGRVPEWLGDLSTALLIGMVGFVVGGLFIGIAFQPLFYHFAAMTIALQQYVRRLGEASVSVPAKSAALPTPGRAYGWKMD